jgi:hypothetical protein
VSKKRADICYIFPSPVTGTKYKSRNLAYIFPVKIKNTTWNNVTKQRWLKAETCPKEE